jgi:hypothetical protein
MIQKSLNLANLLEPSPAVLPLNDHWGTPLGIMTQRDDSG